jgi:hypothetical protein
MSDNLPAHTTQRLADFLAKVRPRGRLIFIIDATASRQPTWDAACQLQSEMFSEAGRLGGLNVQLVYFRGSNECRATPWTCDPAELARKMRTIICESGHTQIGRALAHARKEHARQPVNATIYIGDMCEEERQTLYDAAAGLDTPLFMFMEGRDADAEAIFREMARLSKGAFERFDTGATTKLVELLKAVAAFAVGGLTALADQRSDAARLLLGQMSQEGPLNENRAGLCAPHRSDRARIHCTSVQTRQGSDRASGTAGRIPVRTGPRPLHRRIRSARTRPIGL